jgi:hypothetical protein
MTHYTYIVFCPMTEAQGYGPETRYYTKDGWRFVSNEDGAYLFENKESGESHFYPVAGTFLCINRVKETT